MPLPLKKVDFLLFLPLFLTLYCSVKKGVKKRKSTFLRVRGILAADLKSSNFEQCPQPGLLRSRGVRGVARSGVEWYGVEIFLLRNSAMWQTRSRYFEDFTIFFYFFDIFGCFLDNFWVFFEEISKKYRKIAEKSKRIENIQKKSSKSQFLAYSTKNQHFDNFFRFFSYFSIFFRYFFKKCPKIIEKTAENRGARSGVEQRGVRGVARSGVEWSSIFCPTVTTLVFYPGILV